MTDTDVAPQGVGETMRSQEFQGDEAKNSSTESGKESAEVDALEGQLPRVVNAPERIYLQFGVDDEVDDVDFSDCSTEDVSWCIDQIFATDVEYIRADLVTSLVEQSIQGADSVKEETVPSHSEVVLHQDSLSDAALAAERRLHHEYVKRILSEHEEQRAALIKERDRLVEQFELLDDPDGLYTETKSKIEAAERERCARICVKCKHDEQVDQDGYCTYLFYPGSVGLPCGCKCVFTSTSPATQSFYVVSDTWNGRALHVCDTREEAAHNQYLETLTEHGYNEDSDQSEVRPEQFRAWPAATFPHDLSFEEAFEWIGKQSAAIAEEKLLPCPFCGEQPNEFEDGEIQCSNKRCDMRPHARWGGARVWNTRASRTPLPQPDPWARFKEMIRIANTRPCPACQHSDVASDGLCAASVPLIDKEPHGSKRCGCPCVNLAWQSESTLPEDDQESGGENK